MNGTLWPIPIVFGIANDEIKEKRIKEKDTILLTYNDHALAILEIEKFFNYNKLNLEQAL